MENPIKMDDLGVPLFLETPISTHGRFVFFFWLGGFFFAKLEARDPTLVEPRFDRLNKKIGVK